MQQKQKEKVFHLSMDRLDSERVEAEVLQNFDLEESVNATLIYLLELKEFDKKAFARLISYFISVSENLKMETPGAAEFTDLHVKRFIFERSKKNKND